MCRLDPTIRGRDPNLSKKQRHEREWRATFLLERKPEVIGVLDLPTASY